MEELTKVFKHDKTVSKSVISTLFLQIKHRDEVGPEEMSELLNRTKQRDSAKSETIDKVKMLIKSENLHAQRIDDFVKEVNRELLHFYRRTNKFDMFAKCNIQKTIRQVEFSQQEITDNYRVINEVDGVNRDQDMLKILAMSSMLGLSPMRNKKGTSYDSSMNVSRNGIKRHISDNYPSLKARAATSKNLLATATTKNVVETV